MTSGDAGNTVSPPMHLLMESNSMYGSLFILSEEKST